jgi:predicted MFS family arabinose efflux permease
VLVHVSAWALARLAPLHRPSLFGIVYSGVGVGIVLAGLACLALMGQGRSSSQGWIALGAIALVVSSTLWRGVGGAREESARPAARFRWSAQRVRMVAAYGAFGFGYIVPATYIPALARQSIPDPAVFGWAWPLFGAAAAGSTLAAAGLLRALSPRQVWIGAQLVMALGVAAPLVLPGWTGIATGAVLVGATFVVVTMVGLQEARRTTGADAARFMAAMTAAFAAGQVAGPVLVSALVGAGARPDTALAVAGAVLVAGTSLLLRQA